MRLQLRMIDIWLYVMFSIKAPKRAVFFKFNSHTQNEGADIVSVLLVFRRQWLDVLPLLRLHFLLVSLVVLSDNASISYTFFLFC